MEREFSPQEDAQLVWKAVKEYLGGIQDGYWKPMAYLVRQVPPGGIALIYEYLGSWRDVTYTLVLTPEGPVSYERVQYSWGDDQSTTRSRGDATDPWTIKELAKIAERIRKEGEAAPLSDSS